MNKISTFFSAIIIVFISFSCEGPEGPPGRDGFDGLNGANGSNGVDGIQGQVFEVEGVNFDYDASANLFSTLLTFSDFTNFETLNSDVVLVYRFEGEVEFEDGSLVDSWSPLPQNFFTPEGTLQYVFAHTFLDVELFIDGNFDLSIISTDFTDNQIFRIAILPSEFTSSVDVNNLSLNALMKELDLSENDILTVN